MQSRLRAHAVDLFVVLLAVAQQAELWLGRRSEATLAAAVTSVLATLPLLARRRVPSLSILVAVAASAVTIQLFPNGLQSSFFAVLTTGAIAGALPGIASYVGYLALVGLMAEQSWLDPNGGGWGDFGLSTAVISAFWAGGWVIARRSRAARLLLEQMEVAEREAVVQERARITRELHDVVAHGLTVVIVQAAAAQHAVGHGAPADQVLPRLAAAEESARQALADLRRMLGMLRADRVEDMTVPARGRAGIDELVGRVSATGTPVTLTVTGDAATAPVGQDLVVYRIVQESLTNAVKHAPRAAVVVGIDYAADEIRVRIANDAPADAPAVGGGVGHGLIGMRERVTLYGGHLSAAPAPLGGFQVSATMPLGEAPA